MGGTRLQHHRTNQAFQLRVPTILSRASGGSQNYHLLCMYESVVFYLQANGWLNTVLNNQWEVDAFQFYAGDLFDIINNLHLTFSPRAILDGECVAQKEGLSLKSSR
jgi:hypothetical protein